MAQAKAGDRWQIELEWPLCHLLRRASVKEGTRKALTLPHCGDPGTGNIVICGCPGSGKSTLAMQIAENAATYSRVSSLYIALEESPSALLHKADGTKLKDILRSLQFYKTPATGSHHEAFRTAVSQEAPGEGRVWLTSLTPPPLDGSGGLFGVRYRQLEQLVEASRAYNDGLQDNAAAGSIRLVVIDSLAMFGAGGQARETMFRLFDLIRTNDMIGVFVAGEEDGTRFDSTQADVLIQLSMSSDQGYFVRYLEVLKSRYQEHVYGKHTFKLQGGQPDSEENKSCSTDAGAEQGVKSDGHNNSTRGIVPTTVDKQRADKSSAMLAHRTGRVVVFPSMHWHPEAVKETAPPHKTTKSTALHWEFMGVHFWKRLRNNPMVTLLEGPLFTFKTHLARNYLYEGMREGESGLAVLFSNLPNGTDRENQILTAKDKVRFSFEDDAASTIAICSAVGETYLGGKAEISVYQPKDPGRFLHPRLVVLSIRSGAVQPEEVVYLVRMCVEQMQKWWTAGKPIAPIRRAVFDDISALGIDYPLLRRSFTTGTEFLAFLIRIIKQYGIRLAMTGTTGEQTEADDVVQRARLASDAVISCRYIDVFGGRYLTVDPGRTGELAADPGNARLDVVPAVLMVPKSDGNNPADGGGKPIRHFQVVSNYLDGLTGFGNGRIQRPGILLHLFTEYHGIARERAPRPDAANQPVLELAEANGNDARTWLPETLHETYSRLVEELVHATVARSPSDHEKTEELEGATANVSVHRFGAGDSHVVHESLKALTGPLDRTVIYTLDEFGATDETQKRLAALRDMAGDGGPGKGKAKARDEFSHLDFRRLRAPDESPSPDTESKLFPLYRNVLLIAYKEAFQGRVQDIDWTQLATTGLGFAFDRTADETLACLLLDAVSSCSSVAATGRGQTSIAEVIAGASVSSDSWEACRTAILSVAKILRSSVDVGAPAENRLPGEADAYICWYSQLRQLIHDYPELAGRLRVRALPGRGFSGDWYLGVARGSVSAGLGRRVVGMICSQEEDERRFLLGVGLPAGRRSKLVLSQRAWLGSQQTLGDVLSIHKRTYCRRHIRPYGKVRALLASVMRQLTAMDETEMKAAQAYLDAIWTHAQTMMIEKKTPKE